MSPVVIPVNTALSSPPSQGGKRNEVSQGGLEDSESRASDWNSLTREQQQKQKEELLAENEEMQAKRTHYPFTHAPKELLRTKYLSPYLPETTTEDFYINSMLDWTNPELANLKRAERWRPDRNTAHGSASARGHLSAPLLKGGHRGVGLLSPNATFPADEETDYEYDQANRLTTVHLINSSTLIEFEYDGIGRRLKKTITDDTGTGSEDVVVTTIKYHYIGGQLTTIEIDEETTDDSDPPVETTTKDETIHIHLGPNSQPISFEWVRYDYDEEETLDDTYWFHYDIHGNVLKVTDDTQTTKITYTYNTLGELTTETNPDNIPNFFKFRGASQTLHDSELDLYFGGGFYRPDLGTSLATVGVASNPTSGATVSAMAHSFRPASQLALHAPLADTKSKIAMDCAPSSGATKATPKPPTPKPAFNNVYDYMNYDRSKNSSGTGSSSLGGEKGNKGGDSIGGIDLGGGIGGGISLDPGPKNGFYPTDEEIMAAWYGISVDAYAAWQQACNSDGWYGEYCKRAGPNNYLSEDKAKKVIDAIIKKEKASGGIADGTSQDEARYYVAKNLEWAVWGTEGNGDIALLGYQLSGKKPRFFNPDGSEYVPGTYLPGFWVSKWDTKDLDFMNLTGQNLVVVGCGDHGHTFKLYIPANYDETINGTINLIHHDFKRYDGGTFGMRNKGDIFSKGNVIVVKGAPGTNSGGEYFVYGSNGDLLCHDWLSPSYSSGEADWHRFFFDEWYGHINGYTPGHWVEVSPGSWEWREHIPN